MAKIYSAPTGIKVPQIDFLNFNAKKEEKKENKYIDSLKRFLNRNGYAGENVGEIVKFQVADGYALYMVVSMKPLALMHIPIRDAYHFEYANRLTAEDIQERLDAEKKLEELFKKKE